MKADWYFDFISPFAYLQFFRLSELPNEVELSLKPVLFAGLLNAHGQKGPAEIPPKKLFTYRFATWQAKRRGVPFSFPIAHPFNPIRALRLSIAAGNSPQTIHAIFNEIWGRGLTPDSGEGWAGIKEAVGLPDADEKISAQDVKQQLIENGEEAISRGVFGVPTFYAEDELFWGDDALDFFVDWIADRSVLDNPDMEKLTMLEGSASRT